MVSNLTIKGCTCIYSGGDYDRRRHRHLSCPYHGNAELVFYIEKGAEIHRFRPDQDSFDEDGTWEPITSERPVWYRHLDLVLPRETPFYYTEPHLQFHLPSSANPHSHIAVPLTTAFIHTTEHVELSPKFMEIMRETPDTMQWAFGADNEHKCFAWKMYIEWMDRIKYRG